MITEIQYSAYAKDDFWIFLGLGKDINDTFHIKTILFHILFLAYILIAEKFKCAYNPSKDIQIQIRKKRIFSKLHENIVTT